MTTTILILGAAQALFLVVLLVSKKERKLPDVILAVWLLLLASHLLVYYVYALTGSVGAQLLNFNSSFPFLQGPFLYFYVATIIDTERRLRKSFVLHLIPFFAFNVFILSLPYLPHAELLAASDGGSLNLFSVSKTFSRWLLASVPVYAVWCSILVSSHRRQTEALLSDVEAVDLAWLKYLIGALGAVWLSVIIIFALRSSSKVEAAQHYVLFPVAVFVYVVGYFGLKQRVIISDYHLAETIVDGAEGKYSKSGLDEAAGKELYDRLLVLMQAEKPFLNSDLTLPELAKLLNVSGNHLSQIMNEIGNASYYDFINTYRVREFQDNLTKEEFQNYTLLAVAMQSGFASKPSFNRAVKKITGKTPSQFVPSPAQ